MRHAHAVDFIQQVVLQIIELVEQHVSVQEAYFARGRQVGAESSRPRAVVVLQETGLPLPGKRAVPEQMSFVGFQQRTLQQSLQLVFKADFGVRYGLQKAGHAEGGSPQETRYSSQRARQAVGSI